MRREGVAECEVAKWPGRSKVKRGYFLVVILGCLQVRAENEEGEVQGKRMKTDAERSKVRGWQAGMEWRGPGFGLEGERRVRRTQKCGGGLSESGVGRRRKRDGKMRKDVLEQSVTTKLREKMRGIDGAFVLGGRG